MTMESEALKEINELRAQVNAWDEAFSSYVYSGIDDKFLELFSSTPKQCLKQHDIALLNSLIADFVKGSVPFEDVVASRLNSLELEK